MTVSSLITIRGFTYHTTKDAAEAIGVTSPAITKAKNNGTLETVGLKRSDQSILKYDAQLDADYILTDILNRRNWSLTARDKIQDRLLSLMRRKTEKYNARKDADYILTEIMFRVRGPRGMCKKLRGHLEKVPWIKPMKKAPAPPKRRKYVRKIKVAV